MNYIRRQNFNPKSFLDDTILRTYDGEIELNPTSKVTIDGDLFVTGNIPGTEISNVMYVTIDGNDDNTGMGPGADQAKRTLKAACAVAQEGTTIYIKSGEYYEDNPIQVPPKVSIIGDNLRNVIVRPLNGPESWGATFVRRTSGYVTLTTGSNHTLSVGDRVRVATSDDSVNMEAANITEVTINTFTYRCPGADMSATAVNGSVKKGYDMLQVNSHFYLAGLVFKGLQAPAYCIVIDDNAIVSTSPYIQNCSNINGPWLKNGTEWLPFVTEQPDLNGTMVSGPRPLLDSEIDPGQVSLYGVDVVGAGGGILADGDRYNSESPIKSFIADAFTQVNQGGIGFHITNFAYTQLVSCFNIFSDKAYYTTFGGYLSISNSVVDFGNKGFVADGYYPDPYDSGLITQDYYSTVGSVTISSNGAGYTVAPTAYIDPPTTPGGRQATATVTIDPILQIVNSITIDDAGAGYDFQPEITFTGGGSPTAQCVALLNLAKNLTVDVHNLANKPQVGSIMFLEGDDTGYYVTSTQTSTFTFSYNEQKCRRDVGTISNAVLADMVFGSNYQSLTSGLAYLRSYSSKVTSLQKSQTIAGINKARDLMLALPEVSGNGTATARINANFNIITSIINLGTVAAPIASYPLTTSRRGGYAEASAILQANKAFIQQELIAWLNLNYPAIVGLYSEALTARDTGFILDGISYDLVYEGNSATRVIALGFGDGSVLGNYLEETVSCHQYFKTIIGKILKNQVITPTTGNIVSQNTSLSLGSPSPLTGPAVASENLLQIVIDALDHGPGYVPDLQLPNFSRTNDPALLTIQESVIDEIPTIQDSTIEFLNSTYGGVTTVAVFPAVQSVVSGSIVRFHNVSTISTGGTAIEYVGSGITYNALPFYGGEPDPTKERIEINNGRCFTVTSDQVGNYKVGRYFTVNALTGGVTIDAENIDLTGLAAIGPFKRNGIPVGEQLREVSNNTSLIASNGQVDVHTVPTQFAVKTFAETNYLNKVTTSPESVASDKITFDGDIEVNGGDITTTATTFNLLDDTATTINIGSDATTINVGAMSGTTTINNANTVVAGDLAVNGGDFTTTQTTFNLLNATATSVNFAGAGTSVNVGANTGTLTIGNPTVVGTQATQNVFNATATTVNAFGAGTAITVGATTGTLTLNNPTVVGTQTSVNLWNATTTTVNAFGAATAINVGASTGTLTLSNATVVGANATQNLYNTVATTLNFAGASTALLMGATTGTATIRNPVLVGTETTQDIYNTVATTVNAFGAATTLKIGSTTGTSTFYGTTITFPNATNFNINGASPTIASTSTGTLTLFNTNLLTVDAFGAATTIGIGATSGTLTIKNPTVVGTQATVNLWNTTSTTVNAFGAGTAIGVGAITGTLTLNNPTVVGTQTTVNLWNTTSTTVNAFGAAGTIAIGATTGTTTLNNPTVVGSQTTVNLWNTTSTTVNAFGAGNAITVGAITGTLTLNNPTVVGSQTTVNLWNTTSTTVNAFGAGTAIGVGAITGTLTLNNPTVVGTQTTVNLWNTTSTTVNAFGAATAISIGAATGTTTINNANTVVAGDLAVNGGDITTTATTFNLLNATATTVNAFGASTAISIGASTGTLTINNPNIVSSLTTVNLLNATTTTVNAFGVATSINIGTSAASANTTVVGPAITNNIVKLASTASGTINLTTDVTTGIVNIFAGVTTGTTNIVTGGAGTINIGGTGSNVNIKELHLTTALEVASGGTGLQTITNKGVMYGTGTTAVGVTAASNPGSNATTSYGMLTTDSSNTPVWTDVIDGGTF